MLDLAIYRRNVFSAPVSMAAYAEWRGGALNPREALDWRRSG
jgi:hypothetical protein